MADEVRILTPDQRPRVFLSSTLAEMAPERLAARRAVESLRLIPVMFELGARPHPARALYRAYLAQSHVFVGMYAERYGWVAPDETISGLEDEYRLSGELPRLVYVKSPAPAREERLEALLDRIRADDQVSYKSFSDPEELERLLREDLAVLLGERFLHGGWGPEPATDVDAPAVRPVEPRPPTAPLPRPLTDLVGRDAVVGDVVELLRSGTRLVTLVGPGGIGKTRVALEVAHRLGITRQDEVVFVALDAVRDPGAVLPAVGTALGIGLDGSVPAVDALVRALRDRRLLLVLDNLEQVLDAAPDVRALLERLPGLAVLATSRAPLRLRGEHQVPIGPLGLPDGSDVAGSAAVQLFVERAREVRPDLTLDDPVDARAVAELTRRLEGIPLALELAAARSRTLPPRALLTRVRSALDLGAGAVDVPERQRTLRDTVAWSEELLPPPERLLLAELAVFEAPWTLEDAEAIASAEVGDVESAVAGLVQHSLAHPSAGTTGEPRFRLYQAVRDYARERAPADRLADTQARYIERMATVIRALDAGFRSPDHDRWRTEFRVIWPDLRAALELALDRRETAALGRLTGAWVGLWMDGRAGEITDLIARALALSDEDPPADHGDVVLSATGLAFNIGDDERSEQLARRLRDEDLAAALPEKDGTIALYQGYLAAGSGDLASAETYLHEACRLLDGLGTGGRWIGAFAHNGLGSLYALQGRLADSFREFAVSEEQGRRYGNVAAEMQALVFVAAMRVGTGDAAEAARLLKAAADIVDRYPFYESNAYCVEVAGAVALAHGDAPAAAEALGAARALRDVVGARVWPLLAGVTALIEQNVRAALEPSDFDAAVARGAEIDLLTLADRVRALITDPV